MRLRIRLSDVPKLAKQIEHQKNELLKKMLKDFLKSNMMVLR